MQQSHILAIAVFLLTFILIVVKPKRLNEAHAALIGATLSIVFLLKPTHVLEAMGSLNTVPTERYMPQKTAAYGFFYIHFSLFRSFPCSQAMMWSSLPRPR